MTFSRAMAMNRLIDLMRNMFLIAIHMRILRNIIMLKISSNEIYYIFLRKNDTFVGTIFPR